MSLQYDFRPFYQDIHMSEFMMVFSLSTKIDNVIKHIILLDKGWNLKNLQFFEICFECVLIRTNNVENWSPRFVFPKRHCFKCAVKYKLFESKYFKSVQKP